MSGRPQSPLSIPVWIGHALGVGLRQAWEAVCEIGRAGKAGFRHSHHSQSHPSQRTSTQRKTPVRAFGFFLVGFQAIVFILFAGHRRSAQDLMSGRILLSPPSIGISHCCNVVLPGNLESHSISIAEGSPARVLVTILYASFWMLTVHAAVLERGFCIRTEPRPGCWPVVSRIDVVCSGGVAGDSVF